MTEWRTCIGFEDYQVNEEGQVRRSRPGYSTLSRVVIGRILRHGKNEHGYPLVVLSAPGPWLPKTVKVHLLVARAFLGPKPSDKHEVAHGDGNPGNPQRDNLRWATKKENQADRYKHGTAKLGEKNKRAKLANADVARIRESSIFGANRFDLGPLYDVHPGHIWHLLKRSKLVTHA